jgi:hypothetical protein
MLNSITQVRRTRVPPMTAMATLGKRSAILSASSALLTSLKQGKLHIFIHRLQKRSGRAVPPGAAKSASAACRVLWGDPVLVLLSRICPIPLGSNEVWMESGFPPNRLVRFVQPLGIRRKLVARACRSRICVKYTCVRGSSLLKKYDSMGSLRVQYVEHPCCTLPGVHKYV